MGSSKRLVAVGAVAVGALLFGATAVWALILVAKTPEQKQRRDIGKQTAKFVVCVVKAALKCEEAGVTAASECNFSNPASSTVPDQKAKDNFVEAIAKCEGKLNLAKKGTFYAEIGCPGDSNMGTAGDQPYANLAAFQAGLPDGTYAQLNLLTPLIVLACGSPPAAPTDPAVMQCVADQSAALASYAKRIFKCESKCENDYKDKKGNGGPDDDTARCAAGDAGADANFELCVNAALTKTNDKFDPDPLPGLVTGVNDALAEANNDLYNECDCAGAPCP